MSQGDLPAGQNPRLFRGQSRFFGVFRDGQERLRFRCPVDKVEVAGLTLAKPYYDFLKEMALDRIVLRDVAPQRLANKAIRMLRARHPLPGMVLKGVKG